MHDYISPVSEDQMILIEYVTLFFPENEFLGIRVCVLKVGAILSCQPGSDFEIAVIHFQRIHFHCGTFLEINNQITLKSVTFLLSAILVNCISLFSV